MQTVLIYALTLVKACSTKIELNVKSYANFVPIMLIYTEHYSAQNLFCTGWNHSKTCLCHGEQFSYPSTSRPPKTFKKRFPYSLINIYGRGQKGRAPMRRTDIKSQALGFPPMQL